MTTEKKKPKKFKKRNLVSLVWPTDVYCVDIIVGVPKEVTVDLLAGTWSFQGRTQPIGTTGQYRHLEGYPIGVYDRTNIRHLRAIVDTVGSVGGKPYVRSDD